MTRKKPGATIGRPKDVKRNEECLDRLAQILARPGVCSYTTAAELAADAEGATKNNPTDPRQYRRLWKNELDAAMKNGTVGPDGELLYSHARAERALMDRLKEEGRAPALVDGKFRLNPKTTK